MTTETTHDRDEPRRTTYYVLRTVTRIVVCVTGNTRLGGYVTDAVGREVAA